MKPPLLLLAALLAASAPSGAEENRQRDIAFAEVGGRTLRLDLYRPETPAPTAGYPLILSIHGGGWLFGDRRKDLFLRDLTRHGYAVASIDYRLSGTVAFPAQIEDCRQALRHLIRHARALQLDPRRIGVTGASAGGHLALLLGLAETHVFAPDDRPFAPGTIRAVCAFYPPTDLVAIIPPNRRDRRDNLVAQLLGGPVLQRLALAREASPMTYVSAKAPPTLLIHGDRDSLVPLRQSQDLVSALRVAGADSRLIIYEGRGHAFGPAPETVQAIARFFDQNVKGAR